MCDVALLRREFGTHGKYYITPLRRFLLGSPFHVDRLITFKGLFPNNGVLSWRIALATASSVCP
ncbi:hypothetical protein Plhal304r1_c022g0076401 [Plasmopara halstedii]